MKLGKLNRVHSASPVACYAFTPTCAFLSPTPDCCQHDVRKQKCKLLESGGTHMPTASHIQRNVCSLVTARLRPMASLIPPALDGRWMLRRPRDRKRRKKISMNSFILHFKL